MYWRVGQRKDSEGIEVIFYEYFDLEYDLDTGSTDLRIRTAAASSEEMFLEYYNNNKQL